MTDDRLANLTVPQMPEPGSLVLLGTGLLALARTVRKQRRQNR
jgi:hypothetical protein